MYAHFAVIDCFCCITLLMSIITQARLCNKGGGINALLHILH